MTNRTFRFGFFDLGIDLDLGIWDLELPDEGGAQ